MLDLNQLDVPSLLAGAGLSGALISGLTTAVKAVTGWKGRRAVLTTLLLGGLVIAFQEAARYWTVINHCWDGFLQWMMATGIANSGYQAWEKMTGGRGPNPFEALVDEAEASQPLSPLKTLNRKDLDGHL